MVILLGLLLSLLALLGERGAAPEVTPVAATGSIRVIARACPIGVTAANASSDLCPVWPRGAAIQASDVNGNAWGMNASHDSTLPGDPVVYELEGLAFGVYTLGEPSLPSGFKSYFIAGAQQSSGGNPQIELSVAVPHAELTVYYLPNE